MAPKLTIYYTSDMHGFLYPTTHGDDALRPMGLLGMIPQFQKDGNTLVLDCGDTIQGSPLTYYCHSQGLPSPMIPAMNAAGYDAVTLGNHDFNFGYDALYAYLTAVSARCVCANVKDRAGRLPIVPYTVRTLENGLRVGITGAVTDWVNRWEQPDTLAHFEIGDPFAALQSVLAALRKQVDFTVCLYHGGIEKDLKTGRLLSDTDENIACRIAEELDFHLLLTGHQHIPLANITYRGTHLVQTPASATHFAKIEMREDGSITSRLLPSDPLVMPPIAAGMAGLKRELDAWLGRPIGRLNMVLAPEDKLQMALYGAPIANFFNQVQLAASGADISVTSLPNDMRGFEKSVTVRDVVATYVYANTLVVLRVTGRVLREALERCAAYFAVSPEGEISVAEDFLMPKVAHYNYDFFLGIEYTFDLSKPVGQRVACIARNGVPVSDDQSFTLCMNNYRATGTGGYEAYLACPRLREINREVSELILDYLAEHGDVTVDAASPLTVIFPERA